MKAIKNNPKTTGSAIVTVGLFVLNYLKDSGEVFGFSTKTLAIIGAIITAVSMIVINKDTILKGILNK